MAGYRSTKAWLAGLMVAGLLILAEVAVSQSSRDCRKVVLTGEVKAGDEWKAELGEGWVFRAVPIGSPKGREYSGWDLVVDREQGGGYPDALLLATPPYGSLNEREIGTTFGLRAQDAIGWNPRRFRFLTSAKELERARALFGAVMAGGANVTDAARRTASAELLGMMKGASAGEFKVLDAKLSAGAGDAPEFARQWAARLRETPHTVEQRQGESRARGELKWMRFSATLWLPRQWHPAPGVGSELARCAQ